MLKKHEESMKALLKLAMSIPKIIWDVGTGWVMVLFDGYMLAMPEDEAKKKGYFDLRRKE